jgi:hypothetical protein
MAQKDYVKIGKYRMSRAKFKKRFYQIMSLIIALLFVSGLLYTILFGKSPN